MNWIEYLLIVTVSGIAILIWAMNLWGGWAEKFYRRYKNSSSYWYWLRLAGIELSEKNCGRFVKWVSLAGIVFVSVGVAVATHAVLRPGG